MSLGDDLARESAGRDDEKAAITQGTVTGFDWTNGLLLVNVGGGSVAMRFVGDAPIVGTSVLVGHFGKTPICLGMVGRSSSGVVASVPGGGQITVTGDDGKSYTLGYVGTAPTAGQRVAILWSNGRGVIVGVPSYELPGGGVSSPGGVAPVAKSYVFPPIASGNWYNGTGYTNGASGSEVWCSSSNKGVYVYGDVIGPAIPDGATFVPGSLGVWLAEFYNQFPSSLAQIGLTALAGLTGDPAPFGLVSIRDARTDGRQLIQLPDTYESFFRLGTARGLAFNNGPGFHKYRPAGVENSGVIVGKWVV